MSTVTPPVRHWEEEFNKRIAAFSRAIGLSEEVVRRELATIGVDGKSDQSLDIIDSEEYLPTSDLFALFCDSCMVPKPRLRLGLSHLRGRMSLAPTPTTNEDDLKKMVANVGKLVHDTFASSRPKEDWSIEELVGALNEDATEVAKVLSEKTHARPCIIFAADGSVDVAASLPLCKLARTQKTHDQHQVNGRVVRVYRVGEFIAKPVDESPFFPGSQLVNGYCAQSNTDWTNVSHEARVLVRIYSTGEKLSKKDMKDIHRDALQGATAFRTEYGEAAMRYDELAAADQLPKLKILPSQVADASKIDKAW